MNQEVSLPTVFSRARIALFVFVAIGMIAVVLSVSSSTQNAEEKYRQTNLPEKFAVSDEVTNDIRDGSKTFFRVNVKSETDRETAAGFGRIVADYGNFVVIAKPRGNDLRRLKLENQPFETSINAPGAVFDPIKSPPADTIWGNSGGYYIVQFGGIATDEWLESLRKTGVEILQYVPHNAFFVHASEEAILKASSHSRVRWVGAFTPEYKISDILRNQISAAKTRTLLPNNVSPLEITGENSSVFDIAIFKRADANRIAETVSTIYGGRVRKVIDLPNNYFNVVRVELSLDEVLKIAEIPEVISIDFYSTPQIEDERAAHIVAGNYTSSTVISGPGYNPLTQFGVDGTNVTVAVADDGISIPGNGGFYVTAANTVHGVLRGASAGATGGHGHINASIIAGSTPFGILDPTGHNYGLGVAPKAHIINSPFLVSGYSGSELDVYNDTVITPGPNGVNGSISNNSWGNGTNSNVYDAYTAQFDGFVRDTSSAATIDPITIVFSAGNSGPGALSLTRPKTAKNVIATGNLENIRPELVPANPTSADNMDDLRSTSSRGPAADGRVKPDIMAPGTVITGSRAGSCGSVSSCFDANHAYSTGTSHAAPQIAGAAALFTQFWKNGNGGVNPSPALIKAAVINTAQEMNGTSTGTAIPNGNEGWGRINMKLMLNTGVPMKHVNESSAFTDPGNSTTFTGTVGNATKPVRVSLVWTDPPGAPNANPALVNNLDLTVTIGANTYKGNVFTGGVSTTGGSADTINNVENIFLPAGIAAGTNFSITVSATAVNGDGILGNADTTDQHFALVAYNFNEASPSAAISGTVTYGNAIGAPSPRFVSNATVNGTGPSNLSTTTGFPGGDYSLTGFLVPGTYVVTLTKTSGVNGITSFDAARVAQHVAGVNVLTGNQFTVANASGNGGVTSFDAALIARYAASLPDYGLTARWVFQPFDRIYSDVTANITDQDYTALLMGEVSGNWSNAASRSAEPVDNLQSEEGGRKSEIVVGLSEMSAKGSELTIPVNVQGVAGKGIISYEFDLRYDASVIQPLAEPVDVQGTASRGLVVVTNATEPGLLRVVVYGAMAIDKDGILLNLRFTSVGAAGSVSPLIWEQIIFNEGERAVLASNGQIEIK